MLINASAARQNFFRLIEAAVKNHEPVMVTSKQGNVVIISEEDYRAIQETMYLLNVPGMRESIIEGMRAAPEDCVKAEEIEW
ncbi:RelB/StbD replicon stabilization protein [Desulfocucumis palustris]|uniref:Antitoxin n=1 Tax=Desulfocucumis palustris TaxID=1898651 RepID=A0A2L2XHF2_9FIRM|nr:type II toxin-antitoxin system Phd/YefM family antitoxin [Desulfocucumis palustris]GBF35133.1 RelB/StbD replicon stabilization protein [Desulfocucumis palustris]